PKTMERSPGHYEEWVNACRGGKTPVASYAYSGPMTEIVLLGVLSLRSPGTRLEWDSESMKVKNAPELNQYTHIEYRKGYSLSNRTLSLGWYAHGFAWACCCFSPPPLLSS